MIKTIGTAPNVPDIGTLGSAERTMGAEVESFLDSLDTYLSTRKSTLPNDFANAVDVVVSDYVYNGRFTDVGGKASYPSAGDGAAVINTTLLHRNHPAGWQFLINSNVETFVTGGTVTANISTEIFTKTAHGKATGDACKLTTTGALPTGVLASTVYYMIVIDVDTFYLCTSRHNAYNGTYVSLSGTQSGTHTVWFEYDETQTLENISGGGLKFKYAADSGDIMIYQSVSDGISSSTNEISNKTYCLEVDIQTANEETYLEIIHKTNNTTEPTPTFYQKITDIGKRTKIYAYKTFGTFVSGTDVLYVGVSVKNSSLLSAGSISVYDIKFYQSAKPVSNCIDVCGIPVGYVVNTTDRAYIKYGFTTTYSANTFSLYKYRRLYASIGDADRKYYAGTGAFNAINTQSVAVGTFGYLRAKKTNATAIGTYNSQAIQSHNHLDAGHTHAYTPIRVVTSTTYTFTAQATTTGYANLGNANAANSLTSASNVHGEHIAVGGFIRV